MTYLELLVLQRACTSPPVNFVESSLIGQTIVDLAEYGLLRRVKTTGIVQNVAKYKPTKIGKRVLAALIQN